MKRDTYHDYFTAFELREHPVTFAVIAIRMWKCSGLSNIPNRGFAVDDDFFTRVRKVKVFALSSGWTGR